ncbi:MAG: hypothetical protein QOC86_720, partial [Gaiellales bacterium]|nr:hypothetical protein [Gaiellales bacterium]
ELARQFDRLDVRPESPSENTLEEGFDLLFDSAENHGPGFYPGERC